MKKCPFCAEQIQDEAIVCRYCGRDLKPPEPPVELGQKATEPKPVQKSIWMSARPAAIVIAILYALNVFATTPNKGELIGDLTLGLAVTFFVWWAICAFIIWLWRSMGAAVFILLGIVTLLVVLAWSNIKWLRKFRHEIGHTVPAFGAGVIKVHFLEKLCPKENVYRPA